MLISRRTIGAIALPLFLSLLLLGLPNRALAQKTITTEVGVLNVTPEDSAASGLSADITFRDSTGDGQLAPNEKGTLDISIANRADGPASNVDVWVYPKTGGDQIRMMSSGAATGAPPDGMPDQAVRAGRLTKISSGMTRRVSMQVRGAPSLSGTPISLAVALRDEYGFAPSTAQTLAVQTKKGSARLNRPPVVDRKVPTTNMERPNAIAVVIGNRSYKNPDIPPVEYAVRDARTMKKYLTRTLGFREKNIIYVENASGTAMERIFGSSDSPKGQLYDWVKPGKSEVFVYYSGHGAPHPESGTAYFVPTNANPNYLSQSGYPVNQLYANLSKIPAKSVTVVLEACFSGVSEGGAVVQNVSPAVLSVENPVMSMQNGLAFTAGQADQVSTWYNEKKHGLFTYYFLKGLRGRADANGNRAITAREMKTYLKDKVPYRAQRMHSRKQTPQVVGRNLDRVLVRYEKDASSD